MRERGRTREREDLWKKEEKRAEKGGRWKEIVIEGEGEGEGWKREGE